MYTDTMATLRIKREMLDMRNLIAFRRAVIVEMEEEINRFAENLKMKENELSQFEKGNVVADEPPRSFATPTEEYRYNQVIGRKL